MKNTGICIISVLGGMIVGSALAMLLTPQSGPELRHHLHGVMEEELAKAKAKASAMGQKIHDELETACCTDKSEC